MKLRKKKYGLVECKILWHNVCKMKSADLDLVQDHIQITSSYAKKD